MVRYCPYIDMRHTFQLDRKKQRAESNSESVPSLSMPYTANSLYLFST